VGIANASAVALVCHGRLTPTALVLRCERLSAKKTIFAMRKRMFTRAAGVSPPWFGRHVYADTRAIARKTADSMWADHRCHRVQRYHGGLTPPAPGALCRLAGENDSRGAHRISLRKATFAVRKRRFTRAAGVSPPWFYEPNLQVQCDQFPRFELACAVHSTGGLRPPARGCMRDTSRAICVSDSQRRMCPTGAYAAPLLVWNACAGRIMHIPAANSTGTSLRS
jgi:hypothetical protein